MSKKYYWLKLKNTYFNQLTQKKMKRQPNGKELQIIYLRMLLCSLDKDGYIYFQNVYDSLEEELAEEFDEPVGIVKQTIDFLVDNKMISIDGESNCFMPEAVACTGSESESAERMRRKRKNDKASQCDGDVRTCDTERRDKSNNILCSPDDKCELEKEENPVAKTVPEQDMEDFMKIYSIYPKKRGKSKAFEYYRGYVGKGREINGIRRRLDKRQIYLAVYDYVRERQQAGTELQYYQNFDTFMNKTVLDYLPEETEI